MFSIIAMAMRLFSKEFTYPELGQIQNWQKNCSEFLLLTVDLGKNKRDEPVTAALAGQ